MNFYIITGQVKSLTSVRFGFLVYAENKEQALDMVLEDTSNIDERTLRVELATSAQRSGIKAWFEFDKNGWEISGSTDEVRK